MFIIKPCSGLSLIEFLIALAITIILTVAAVPVFTDLYREHHVTAQIQNLHYILQYARSEAIKNNRTIYVNFQTGDNWCYGVNANTTCSCSIPNNCTLGTYTAPRAGELTLSTSGLSSNTLTFEGTHGATNTSSVVTFTIYGSTPAIGIKITPLGNMQFCSSTYSGYTSCS